MSTPNIKSKFLGSMIGSALGDCIGELAFRFGNKEDLIKEINNRNIIQYTDDTAMALGIAETIISTNDNWNTQDLGKTFHKNFNKEPYRGYGRGPPQIFRTVEITNESYNKVASKLFGGEGSFGNGASMRIAPLGLFYYDHPEIYKVAKKSATVTHTHPLGIDGAALLAKLNSILIPRKREELFMQEKQNLIDDLIKFSKTNEYKEKLKKIKDLIINSEEMIKAERILGSDVLAYTSVPFSIFAFLYNPESYKKNLLETVLISKDRDTVGAMIGGLLGSYLGIEFIPDEWIQRLENKDYIEELTLKLFDLKK